MQFCVLSNSVVCVCVCVCVCKHILYTRRFLVYFSLFFQEYPKQSLMKTLTEMVLLLHLPKMSPVCYRLTLEVIVKE